MKRIFLLVFVILLVSISSCKNTSNIYLKCLYSDEYDNSIKYKRDYVLNLNQLTVQDLTHSDIRTGKLTIEEDRFILVFPDIKDYLYEGRIIINRTSGISYWEQGG